MHVVHDLLLSLCSHSLVKLPEVRKSGLQKSDLVSAARAYHLPVSCASDCKTVHQNLGFRAG